MTKTLLKTSPNGAPITSRARTAPKEVRQTQLIDATIACIAERGISGTTMSEITRRAGLSVGIVSLHFDNKDNLLTATLTHLSEEVRETWAKVVDTPGLETAERLRRIALASFDLSIFGPDKIAVWFAFFGEARYRVAYRKMVERYDDERGDVLDALCNALIAQTPGDMRDSAALTQAIESFGDGLWLNALVYPEDFTRDNCMLQMEAFVAALFPNHLLMPALRKTEDIGHGPPAT